MKYALLTAILFVTLSAQAQKNPKLDWYPTEYSSAKFDLLIEAQDFDKAIWYSINLFGIDSNAAKAKVALLKSKVPELSQKIMSVFVAHAPFDPQINTGKDGQIIINGDKMKQKGRWGDGLIRSLN